MFEMTFTGVLRKETGGGPRTDAGRRDLRKRRRRRLQGEGVGLRGAGRGPLLLGQLRASRLLHGSSTQGGQVGTTLKAERG